MRISARLHNAAGAPSAHGVRVETAGRESRVAIDGKAGGGSALNGGELLMLAIATCYCNDLYREAAAMGLTLHAVEVAASAEFDGVGLAARDIRYSARVDADAPPEAIDALLDRTDQVAEVHNSLRAGLAVTRTRWNDGE
jgi:uncharacterized OsmC-like protein